MVLPFGHTSRRLPLLGFCRQSQLKYASCTGLRFTTSPLGLDFNVAFVSAIPGPESGCTDCLEENIRPFNGRLLSAVRALMAENYFHFDWQSEPIYISGFSRQLKDIPSSLPRHNWTNYSLLSIDVSFLFEFLKLKIQKASARFQTPACRRSFPI